MRLAFVLAAAAVGALSVLGTAGDARACGGCFHEPTQSGDVITDHRMIFRVSPQETTLYDEIEYQGNPTSFAWVLPTHGPVTIGLSSDVVFQALDQATATQIAAPSPPPCPSCGCFNGATAGAGSSSSGGSSSGGSAADGGSVTIIGQQTVGPYAAVQLSATDPMALENWLSANGYVIPSSVQPIIDAYQTGGFDFLALKLLPGQSVSAMRPVRVTSPGAGLSLPLRMVAAGTGATVGIALWVIADGRYEPANFPMFTIDPAQLVWDFNTNSSNYTTIRAQKEAASGGAAWQIESSQQISPYQVEGPIMGSSDYLPVPASDAGGDGGAGETADQVKTDDLNTLFPQSTSTNGTVWVTRMRADLAHAALANDLNLQASANQTELSNFYQVTKYVNAPACQPVPNPCPPCDNGGSSGGSSGGVVGGSSGGGNLGLGGSGNNGNAGGGSGCSTVGGDDDSNIGVLLGGLGLAAIAAGRGRRRRD